MSQQTIKQGARRQALDVAARQRRERAERERRLQDLVVQVLTAVGERDAAVADAERRAGTALREMTCAEGLTLREAVAWCGEEISVREATRLRQRAGNVGESAGEQDEPNGPADRRDQHRPPSGGQPRGRGIESGEADGPRDREEGAPTPAA